MLRNRLEVAIEEINNNIIEMGTLVEISIDRAVTGLKTQDIKLAKSVKKYQRRVDEMEKSIESTALQILITQQPVASDLRLISVALKIITDMHRIADQARNIAEISTHLARSEFVKNPQFIVDMAEKAISMVSRSLDAFLNRDQDLARLVIESDDEVDALFVAVRNELIDLIATQPQHGEQAIDMVMISKYLERIADHAVNICEWVIYLATGSRRIEADEDGI